MILASLLLAGPSMTPHQPPFAVEHIVSATLMERTWDSQLLLEIFQFNDSARSLTFVFDGSGDVTRAVDVNEIEVLTIMGWHHGGGPQEIKSYDLAPNPSGAEGSYVITFSSEEFDALELTIRVDGKGWSRFWTVGPGDYYETPVHPETIHNLGQGANGESWDGPVAPCTQITPYMQYSSWRPFGALGCGQGFSHDYRLICDGRDAPKYPPDGSADYCGEVWRDIGDIDLHFAPGMGGNGLLRTPCYQPPNRDGGSGPYEGKIHVDATIEQSRGPLHSRFRVYANYFDRCGSREVVSDTLWQCYDYPFPNREMESSCDHNDIRLDLERSTAFLPSGGYIAEIGAIGAAPGGSTCTADRASGRAMCAQSTTVSFLRLQVSAVGFETYFAELLPVEEESA